MLLLLLVPCREASRNEDRRGRGGCHAPPGAAPGTAGSHFSPWQPSYGWRPPPAAPQCRHRRPGMLSLAPGQKAETLEIWTQAQRHRSQPCGLGSCGQGPAILFKLHPRRAEGTGKVLPRHLGTPCLAQKRLKPPRAILRPKGSTSSARVDPCPPRTVRDVMGAGLCPPSQFGQTGEGSWQEPNQRLQGPDRLLGPWCIGSREGHGEALPTQRWGIAGPAFLNEGLFGEPCPEVRACSG